MSPGVGIAVVHILHQLVRTGWETSGEILLSIHTNHSLVLSVEVLNIIIGSN